MGNATSSALRAEDPVTSAPVSGDDGPAFGSLASLGGPRKFKKKPVLVLDPEELEKAHMMFQDASAELLGEEAPRHEKGASVLGLAPMDDEDATPEDMGASDDSEAGDDDEAIPSAEEVLRMTESRPAVEPEMDPSEDEYIAQQLENLDVDHRIFPSLPLRSEEEIAAEEAAEAAAAQAREAAEEHEDGAASQVAPEEQQAPAPRIDFIPDGDPEDLYVSPFAVEQFGRGTDGSEQKQPETSIGKAFPVNPLPEPEAELEPLPEVEPATDAESAPLASLDDVFGSAPFLDFPTQPVHFEMQDEAGEAEVAEPPSEPTPAPPAADETIETEIAAEPNSEPAPEPLAEIEIDADPQPEADHVSRFELEIEDDWEDEAPLGLGSEPEPESHEDTEFAEAAEGGSYTEIDDEPVDGYAFMYANNPRARTLSALAEGESNSLRAKLLKEREEAMEELGLEERSPSMWQRFTAWLRALFVR